jgi:hypothetical protein
MIAVAPAWQILITMVYAMNLKWQAAKTTRRAIIILRPRTTMALAPIHPPAMIALVIALQILTATAFAMVMTTVLTLLHATTMTVRMDCARRTTLAVFAVALAFQRAIVIAMATS